VIWSLSTVDASGTVSVLATTLHDEEKMKAFRDKLAVVTGAASGIESQTARAFQLALPARE
jgi:NADP-dependent 3-hydroxy acid dehydrogenase YdfG